MACLRLRAVYRDGVEYAIAHGSNGSCVSVTGNDTDNDTDNVVATDTGNDTDNDTDTGAVASVPSRFQGFLSSRDTKRQLLRPRHAAVGRPIMLVP
jgi:hypothetical protein